MIKPTIHHMAASMPDTAASMASARTGTYKSDNRETVSATAQ